MEITIVVHQEGDSFWAEISELPGCFPTGRTLTELREGVAEAAGLYLWDMPGKLSGGPLRVGESRVMVTPPSG